MAIIADADMRQLLSKAKPYCSVILRAGRNRHAPGVDAIIWEHGRRNLSLRAEGRLAIVCPIGDGTDVCGLCVFDCSVSETKQIMDEDPGVKAGVFTYEIHPCRSFPGDALPG